MTLDNLILQKFINTLVSGDPRQIGIRNKKKAAETWKELFNDYTKQMGGSKSNALLFGARSLTSLRLRIELIRGCIASLSKGYHTETAEVLAQLGVRTKVNRLTKDKDLLKVIAEVKSLMLQLKVMQNETDTQIKSAEKVNVRSEFTKTTLELSKFLGFHFDANKQTVSEFIHAVKKLEHDAKQ